MRRLYQRGKRIGAGGMAEVFEADLLGTEGFSKALAIKRILPAWSAEERFAARFIREAQIMSALQHPNIVTVFDFDRDEEGQLFLVMELVKGVDLGRLVDTGPLPVSVAIYIITELLRGLSHVHACKDPEGTPLGLVHRDLSARNVLVSWEGAIKLSDFGVAKAAAAESRVSSFRGTPGYMSPEQIQGVAMDHRADLFSVGVLLYELLTGRRPFQGKDNYQIMAATLQQRIQPPRALRAELPDDLEAIVMQLLEREPARRPPSADVVIDVLEQCAAASQRARTQLIALLRERFLPSIINAEPPAKRVTEQLPIENNGPPAVWLVARPPVAAEPTVPQLGAPELLLQAPAPEQASAPDSPLDVRPHAAAAPEAAPEIPGSSAPEIGAPAPPPGQASAPAQVSAPDARKPVPASAITKRPRALQWATIAVLCLALGSLSGVALLQDDAQPMSRPSPGPLPPPERATPPAATTHAGSCGAQSSEVVPLPCQQSERVAPTVQPDPRARSPLMQPRKRAAGPSYPAVPVPLYPGGQRF